MRIPTRPLKIAITGRSCTGKTVVASELHATIGGNLRSCGELVKAVAQAEYIAVADLSVALHRAFDLETRRWMEVLATTGIAEGSYLDRVLAGLADVFFVKLNCDLAMRVRRLGLRKGASATAEEMISRDRDEDALRFTLYGSAVTDGVHMAEIDTTHRTKNDVVRAILDLLPP